MQNALAIARREFASYFNSPVAYVVLGVYLIAAGALFFFMIGGGFFVIERASLRAFFGIAPWLFMVLAPAVTMRLIAEERRSGTLEVLMTLPVREREVVLGKFLGAMGMVTVGVLFTVPYALSVAGLVEDGFSFDWGPVVGGYLGTLLMASTFISAGMWASALTRNQIVSFIAGLAICFFLIIVDGVAFIMPPTVASVLHYLGANTHFESIARGVIDSRDVVYYLSMTTVGLWLTSSALRAARK